MDKNDLSDERLAFLHQKKKINAFFIIYERYKSYGYAIIYRKLAATPYLNALIDEKNAIVYNSIMDSLKVFDNSRGTFRSLFSSVVEHYTLNMIRRFSRKPISDYVSTDEVIDEESGFRLEDKLVFADSYDSPREYVNMIDVNEKLNELYQELGDEKIEKIIELRKRGYKVIEIARMINVNHKTVRSILSRTKQKLDKKLRKRIK